MKIQSVLIDKSTLNKLKVMSRKLDRSISWLVRDAIKKYLPKKKR